MDAAGSSSSPPLRIVLFPWLAFGHLLPYLELAERLASRGHRVSFVSTPRNLARLPPPIRRHGGGGAVDLVPLTLSRVDGLPDGAESTNDVPGDRLEPLWEAFDALAAPFADYLAAACAAGKPDWVLADTFHHWAPLIAGEHGVPCAMLMPTAAMIAALSCGARDRADLAAAATVFEHPIAAGGGPPAGMPRYEWDRNAPLYAVVHGGGGGGASSPGMSIARRASLTLERCAVAAIQSCPEWELGAFHQAAALLGKPLVPLGLLPPSPDGGRAANAATHGDDDAAAMRWLDAQPAKSVVYVALGSEVPLGVELVHELALGLELAGTRVLWALRKPRGVSDADVLPAGFLERTRGLGLVTMRWVPQMSILAHDAVGAFLDTLWPGLAYRRAYVWAPSDCFCRELTFNRSIMKEGLDLSPCMVIQILFMH